MLVPLRKLRQRHAAIAAQERTVAGNFRCDRSKRLVGVPAGQRPELDRVLLHRREATPGTKPLVECLNGLVAHRRLAASGMGTLTPTPPDVCDVRGQQQNLEGVASFAVAVDRVPSHLPVVDPHAIHEIHREEEPLQLVGRLDQAQPVGVEVSEDSRDGCLHALIDLAGVEAGAHRGWHRRHRHQRREAGGAAKQEAARGRSWRRAAANEAARGRRWRRETAKVVLGGAGLARGVVEPRKAELRLAVVLLRRGRGKRRGQKWRRGEGAQVLKWLF